MKRMRKALMNALLLTLSTGIMTATEPVYEEEPFSTAELDQMLAPIALYPDVLLSQVLMAATYPLEVVEASRWSRAHPDMSGEEAERAVEDRDWDQSVKYLVGFPDLIQRMDDELEWTRRLGDAFLMQEDEVMTRTQALRRRSLEEGSLDEMAHIRVEEEAETIILRPRNVTVIHVPYYSSHVVYGDWWWYDHPPYYWEPPIVHYGRAGLCWSRGIRVSTGFYFSAFDWHLGHIVIRTRYPGYRYYDFDWYRRGSRHDRSIWHHDGRHRRGVAYHDGKRSVRHGRGDEHGRVHHPSNPREQHRREDAWSGNRTPPYRNDRSVRTDRRPRTEPERDRDYRRPDRDRRKQERDRDYRTPDRDRGRDRDPVVARKSDRDRKKDLRKEKPKQKTSKREPINERKRAIAQNKKKNKQQAARAEPPRSGRRGDLAMNQRRDSNRKASGKTERRPKDP